MLQRAIFAVKIKSLFTIEIFLVIFYDYSHRNVPFCGIFQKIMPRLSCAKKTLVLNFHDRKKKKSKRQNKSEIVASLNSKYLKSNAYLSTNQSGHNNCCTVIENHFCHFVQHFWSNIFFIWHKCIPPLLWHTETEREKKPRPRKIWHQT